MKADFALSLSFEGIALLHRAADGWRIVGDTRLDVPDLPGALRELRQRAQQIDSQGTRCKLIIPNDQIRYLSVPIDTSNLQASEQAALAALDGATPYDLDDLAFDLSFDSDVVDIAAVARETLQEAEQFAIEHGFEPVCFVAMPEKAMFDGEPFFGVASGVDDPDAVEREITPVNVVGEFIEPELPPVEIIAEDEQTEPDTSDPTPEQPPEGSLEHATAPVSFISRRSKANGPSSAPPLAGATRVVPAPTGNDPEPSLPSPVAAKDVEIPDPIPTPEPEESTRDTTVDPEPRIEDEPDQEPEFAIEPESSDPDPEPVTEPAPAPETAPKKKSGLTIIRRQEPESAPPAPPIPATATKQTPESQDELQKMTVFGARERAPVGGKPRHLGLILTAGLLLFLAGVAAWAALFLDDGLAGLFGSDPAETELAALPAPQAPSVQTNAPTLSSTGQPETDDTQLTARPDPETTDADGSLDPNASAPKDAASPSDAEIKKQDEENYAVTGIWPRAPEAPVTPEIVDLNNLYEVSVDRTDLAQDAVALPSPPVLDTDQPLDSVTAPAAAGNTFTLDENGLVTPSPKGTLTPEGILVFSGKPPVVPPTPPTRFEVEPEIDTAIDRLAGLRPRLRPTDLVEQNERTKLGGLTRAELGQVRPKSRPRTAKQEAERDETPTAQAVVVSRIPRERPRNFKSRVADTRKKKSGPSEQVAAAVVAPRTVKPKIPSSASVARRATLDNAINLRRINLIGVYGTPSNRRALVRLPSGRYKKVKVGDRVDGGKIVAIGDSELRYQKGGRNVTLKMPRS